MTTLGNVCEFLRAAEHSNPLSSHATFLEDWKEDMREFCEVSEIRSDLIETVLEFRGDMFEAASAARERKEAEAGEGAWKWLLTIDATAQRSTEWYEEGKRILTASEISAIWKGPRSRAALVMSKVPKPDQQVYSRRLAVRKCETGPMDWGVRYEPVVKQILEDTLNIHIHDLGRIHHRTVKGIAASPDGLITEGPPELLGKLVEIKCPPSRVINDTIPLDYWCQMQLQMEVCGISSCEYVEVKFKEPGDDEVVTPGAATGWITLEVNTDTMEMRYQYTNNVAESQEWVTIECYRWELVNLRRVTVKRDEDWFRKIQPDIEAFWKDVDGARAGTWKPPPSTRKAKLAATPAEAMQTCAIQDSGSDKEPTPTTDGGDRP